MNNLLKCIVLVGLYESVSPTSQCTARGRYPNNDVEDCRGYTMCLMGGEQNFTQYKLTCPIGFVYSHKEQQCTNVTNYSCYDSFNCTSRGYFASDNCTSFIACVEAISGLATARLVKCPPRTVFNPYEGLCVHEDAYKCNTKIIRNPTYFFAGIFTGTGNLTFNGTIQNKVDYIRYGILLLTIFLLFS